MVNINDLKHSILELLNHEVIQRLSHVFMGWKPEGQIIIYIFLALVIGFMLGRYRRFHGASFQNRGESLLSRIVLADLGPPDYHLMNHVTLRMSDGTTQIDHVLVSRFGVFVIETKDYKVAPEESSTS
jgi:hypothetical protein